MIYLVCFFCQERLMLALLRHFILIRDKKGVGTKYFLFTVPSLCLISVSTRLQGKTVRMLIIVVVLFGFCWLPYHIVFMYLDFSQSQYTQVITSLVVIVQLLVFVNSACNPVVYAVLNVNFRREFSAMLFRRQPGRRQNTENVVIPVQTVRSDV